MGHVSLTWCSTYIVIYLWFKRGR